MIADFDDLAGSERQALIASVQEQTPPDWPTISASLADKLLDEREAILMAIHWLDQGASGRAREELLRVMNIK